MLTTGHIHAVLDGEPPEFAVEIQDQSVTITSAGGLRFAVSDISGNLSGIDMARELAVLLIYAASRHAPIQGRGERTDGKA